MVVSIVVNVMAASLGKDYSRIWTAFRQPISRYWQGLVTHAQEVADIRVVVVGGNRVDGAVGGQGLQGLIDLIPQLHILQAEANGVGLGAQILVQEFIALQAGDQVSAGGGVNGDGVDGARRRSAKAMV